MKRSKRRNRREWERVVGEQEGSGLSARDFCRKEVIGLSSFYQWRRRLHLKSGTPEGLEVQSGSFIDMGRLESEDLPMGGDAKYPSGTLRLDRNGNQQYTSAW